MAEASFSFTVDNQVDPAVMVVSASEGVLASAVSPEEFLEQGVQLFVFDLRRVLAMSSVWIGLLVSLAKSTQDVGTRRPGVAVVGLDPRSEKLLAHLKILGRSEILFAGSVEAAVAALRGHDAEGPPPAGRAVRRPNPPTPGSLESKRPLTSED